MIFILCCLEVKKKKKKKKKKRNLPLFTFYYSTILDYEKQINKYTFMFFLGGILALDEI